MGSTMVDVAAEPGIWLSMANIACNRRWHKAPPCASERSSDVPAAPRWGRPGGINWEKTTPELQHLPHTAFSLFFEVAALPSPTVACNRRWHKAPPCASERSSDVRAALGWTGRRL